MADDVSVSVVVTITSGVAHLERCLQALTSQQDSPSLEIIVPFDPLLDHIGDLRQRYAAVRFVEMACPPCGAGPDPGLVHLAYDRRRAVGLLAATGGIVAITEDHAIPSERWCVTMVRLHREMPHGAIGGSVSFRGRKALNRAVSLLDFGRYEDPVPEGESDHLSDTNISYKRDALEKVRPVWRDLYHETAVHSALREAGETLWLTPQLLIWHDRGDMRLNWLLRQRIGWARVFAGRRVPGEGIAGRFLLAAGSSVLPFLFTWRALQVSLQRRTGLPAILRTMPALFLLALASACGEMLGYLTARATSCIADRRSKPGFVLPEQCRDCIITRLRAAPNTLARAA